jgi:cutinase
VAAYVANQGQGAAAGTGIARYLSGHYGIANVAVQGVKYPADIAGNLAVGGCSKAGINEAVRLFNMANTKCPNTVITAGGYSQGTACIHRSIPKLSAAVKAKIGKCIYKSCRPCPQGGYEC